MHEAFLALLKFDRQAGSSLATKMLKFLEELRDGPRSLERIKKLPVLNEINTLIKGLDLSKANDKSKTALQTLLDAIKKVKNS
uniref:Uncharacterized protein n=1 Tax=Strigamia maritima TaxID=126957 RepID=T1J8K3_STRMM